MLEYAEIVARLVQYVVNHGEASRKCFCVVKFSLVVCCGGLHMQCIK